MILVLAPLTYGYKKILVFVTRGYPITISISYLLRVLSADTREYEFFWHPYLW